MHQYGLKVSIMIRNAMRKCTVKRLLDSEGNLVRTSLYSINDPSYACTFASLSFRYL